MHYQVQLVFVMLDQEVVVAFGLYNVQSVMLVYC